MAHAHVVSTAQSSIHCYDKRRAGGERGERERERERERGKESIFICPTTANVCTNPQSQFCTIACVVLDVTHTHTQRRKWTWVYSVSVYTPGASCIFTGRTKNALAKIL